MRLRSFFLFAVLTFAASLFAQNEIKLYDDLCDDLQRVFCDYVHDLCEVKYIASSRGQYVGQTLDGVIYGWGYYLADDGSQIIGQYRKGRCFFGITIGEHTVTVGGEHYYVVYDTESGMPLKFVTPMGSVTYPEEICNRYTFAKRDYKDGSCYFGEMLDGKRHGYGLYYWPDGDFWYGRYENGYRQGFGALFKVDRRLFYGRWIADEKVE